MIILTRDRPFFAAIVKTMTGGARGRRAPIVGLWLVMTDDAVVYLWHQVDQWRAQVAGRYCAMTFQAA